MSDRRMEGPGEHGRAVPRDMPDQQVQPGADPLDVRLGGQDDQDDQDQGQSDDEPDDGTDLLPDADEAGAGRRGRPNQSGVNPEQPVPEEPSD